VPKFRSRHPEPVWVDVGVGSLRRVDPGDVLDVPDTCDYHFPDAVWEPVTTKKAAAAEKED